MTSFVFPPEFVWGAATSAYQIEGSPLADGAGESIWHRFTHLPGKIADNDNGDVACDHYRRFAEDVRLMQELGLGAYRFSISWSRVLPAGTGQINQRGLDFYSRLVDALLEHRIQPSATLYHWDLPAALEDRGGWATRESADWFAEYARLMFRTLGDRVPMWATFNEPWVTVDGGYVAGVHAPGRNNWREAMDVARNLLRAHGAAVKAGRDEGDYSIGLVVNLTPFDPASDTAADRNAAARMSTYVNRQFLDPVLLGEAPVEMADMFDDAWQPFDESDLRLIRQPIDFVGINYYLRVVVRDDPAAGPTRVAIVETPNCRRTAMGWEIFPQGLTETLLWVKKRYGNMPLYITENGAAFDDFPGPNGVIDDLDRVEYLRDHLVAARRAIELGVDLRGYFAWSLLDNFEWGYGYSKRFGIVGVDYATQRRTPKASARFYGNVIRSNGTALAD
jgi:beta-glucosidase